MKYLSYMSKMRTAKKKTNLMKAFRRCPKQLLEMSKITSNLMPRLASQTTNVSTSLGQTAENRTYS